MQRQWTKNDLAGITIELIDPVAIEIMTFTPSGLVPMAVGKKNVSIAAPTFFWQLTSGRLRITFDGQHRYDEFTLISRDATTITVRRHNGKVAKYKIVSQ